MKWIILAGIFLLGIAIIGTHEDEMKKRECFKRGGVEVMTDRIHTICISARGVIQL